MAKLIAITGTHGTGKTTLSFLLAAEYKKLGANVKIIQEVARSCPFPLNDKMTVETAHWIYYEHSKKELEACHDHDIVICDRTSFDSFVYAEYLDLDINVNLKECAKSHLFDYDNLYLVIPDIELKSDGIRSQEPKFQTEIDYMFRKEINIGKYLVYASEIFNKDTAWNVSL